MGLHDLSADGSQRVAVPPVTYSSSDSVSLLTMLGNALTNNLSAPLHVLDRPNARCPAWRRC